MTVVRGGRKLLAGRAAGSGLGTRTGGQLCHSRGHFTRV